MTPRLVLALASISLLCVCGASGQGAAQPPFTLKQVGPNVWAAIPDPRSTAPAGANTGFVIGDDGVAVIDTSMSVDANGRFENQTAKQWRRFAHARTDSEICHQYATTIWTTPAQTPCSWSAAVMVLPHYFPGWIHSESLRMFGTDLKPEQKIFIEALLPPTTTYEQGVNLYLGSGLIRVLEFFRTYGRRLGGADS